MFFWFLFFLSFHQTLYGQYVHNYWANRCDLKTFLSSGAIDIQVCAQPMRDGITLQRRLLLAGHKPRISPDIHWLGVLASNHNWEPIKGPKRVQGANILCWMYLRDKWANVIVQTHMKALWPKICTCLVVLHSNHNKGSKRAPIGPTYSP